MIYLVFGRMRQGKSTLGLFIARKCPTRIIFDPRNQFHTSSAVFPGQDDRTLQELLDTKSEIIIRPGLEGENVIEPVAQDILDWTEQNPEEKVCFLIDEANMVGLDSRPQEKFPHLNYLLRSAGEDRINVVITSHRSVEVHPAIRSIANFVCMFRTTHEPDLKVIEDKCGFEVADQLRILPSGQVIIWDDNVGTFALHSDRSVWYVPLNSITGEKQNAGNSYDEGNA